MARYNQAILSNTVINNDIIGLRVDACDHRGEWFPGSVVHVTDDVIIRVQFDLFSSKWDEEYNMNDNKNTRMCHRLMPLYTHVSPRDRVTEIPMMHVFQSLTPRNAKPLAMLIPSAKRGRT